MFTRRQLVLGMLAAGASAHAQQLARAGWRGNSIAPEAWWKHATFVRCSGPAYTFVQGTQALDAVSEVGADTIILPDLAQKSAALFDPAFGTEEELDALLREASARRMHVLLTMPLSHATANPGAVRSWMTRGIAGFDLGMLTEADSSALSSLRTSLDRYPGQRILIAKTTVAVTPRSRDPLTLHIVGEGGTGAPNQLVQINQIPQADVEPGLPASLLPGAVPDLGSLLPLFLMGGAPILDSRLLETESERNALKQVLQLRSTHITLRTGAATALPTAQPDLHAWLLKARTGRENMLLAVNASKAAATLGLGSALAAQHIRGAYLRTLLRSDGGMGAINVDSGVLPPGAAIVAEIHVDAYSPAATQDLDAPPPGSARHSRRRRRRR